MGVVVALLGVVGFATGIVIAAADAVNTGGPEAWAQFGGLGAAFVAVGYLGKRLADGSIVALPVSKMLEESAKREDRLVEMVEDHRALMMAKRLETK